MAKKKLKKKVKKKLLKKKVKKKRINHTLMAQKAEPLKSIIKPTEGSGILATGELLSGKYCNVALLKHTSREFVFDFLLALDNDRVLVSRVITSPKHAKKIHEVLGENIIKYEKNYGKINGQDKI